jgi:arylsulfatase A-like enzyme
MTRAELDHCRNLYAGEVSLVDRWIGYLLECVDALELRETTAVIVTSDHGFYFGEHGFIGKMLVRGNQLESLPLYPEVSRVPLLVRVPGAQGARSSQVFAQHVDLMPTVLDLLDVPVPSTCRGGRCSARAQETRVGARSRSRRPRSPGRTSRCHTRPIA